MSYDSQIDYDGPDDKPYTIYFEYDYNHSAQILELIDYMIFDQNREEIFVKDNDFQKAIIKEIEEWLDKELYENGMQYQIDYEDYVGDQQYNYWKNEE